MFYSQFILAKKGPLGTIWIAAHLERKLRKNQVADTDIGVSVDSILFPDVPIALRLSSHLLLGVVRIYSRKVNYLFDDCSEALLKIKQAFRSTAVDLPPEESTAPYHSITLPETFDLDDFELPDNDILQGNYVDNHISTRDQITLQDTMDGVVYSTSQYGLDERFGDGDASQIGLDLDEELLLDKVTAAGQDGDSDADPQSSVKPMTPLEQDDISEEINETSEAAAVNSSAIQLESFDVNAEFVEYAEAPSTPGLVDEPNLSSVQEALVCDDHLESEDHNSNHLVATESKENALSKSDFHHLGGGAMDQSFHSDSNQGTVECPEENGYHFRDLEVNRAKPLGGSDKPMPLVSDCSEGTIGALDGSDKMENIQMVAVRDNPIVPSVEPQEVRLEETAASPSSPCYYHDTSDTEDPILKSCPGSADVFVSESHMVGNQASIETKIHNYWAAESASAPVVDVEGQACQEPKGPETLNSLVVQEEIPSVFMNMLKPCSTHLNQADISTPVHDNSMALNLQSEEGEPCSLETFKKDVPSIEMQGEERHTTNMIQSEENQILGLSLFGEIHANSSVGHGTDIIQSEENQISGHSLFGEIHANSSEERHRTDIIRSQENQISGHSLFGEIHANSSGERHGTDIIRSQENQISGHSLFGEIHANNSEGRHGADIIRSQENQISGHSQFSEIHANNSEGRHGADIIRSQENQISGHSQFSEIHANNSEGRHGADIIRLQENQISGRSQFGEIHTNSSEGRHGTGIIPSQENQISGRSLFGEIHTNSSEGRHGTGIIQLQESQISGRSIFGEIHANSSEGRHGTGVIQSQENQISGRSLFGEIHANSSEGRHGTGIIQSQENQISGRSLFGEIHANSSEGRHGTDIIRSQENQISGHSRFGEIHANSSEGRHGTGIIQSKENQMLGLSLFGEINANSRHLYEPLDNVVPSDNQLNNFMSSEMPAPEKLLSVPEGLYRTSNMLVQSTPGKEILAGSGVGAGNQLISGKKRSYTESTLTVESLNSSESFWVNNSKRTSGSAPGDNDLLSSILVGKSSVLKMKPTPPVPVSRKRGRPAGPSQQTRALKRKVLMDDAMVLHGDMIRQQLTSTEDIRRIRKKAPCTSPEILTIQIQFMADEIFSEPILTGMSAELMSLHCEAHDLSRIRVSGTDENFGSSEVARDVECIVSHNTIEEGGMKRSTEPVVFRDNVEAQPAGTPIQTFRDSVEAQPAGTPFQTFRDNVEAQPAGTPIQTFRGNVEAQPAGTPIQTFRGNVEAQPAGTPIHVEAQPAGTPIHVEAQPAGTPIQAFRGTIEARLAGTPIQAFRDNAVAEARPAGTPIQAFRDNVEARPTGTLIQSFRDNVEAQPAGTPIQSFRDSVEAQPAGTPIQSFRDSVEAQPAGTPIQVFRDSVEAQPAGTPIQVFRDSVEAQPAGTPIQSFRDSVEAQPVGTPIQVFRDSVEAQPAGTPIQVFRDSFEAQPAGTPIQTFRDSFEAQPAGTPIQTFRDSFEAQPAGTPIESQEAVDHHLGSHDIDTLGHINTITDIAEMQHDPLAEISEMDIDRGNFEVADVPYFPVAHGNEALSQTDVAPVEICNMPAEDKLDGGDASLQMDTSCLTPEQKVDTQPVEEDDAMLVDISNERGVDATEVAVQNVDSAAVETESKSSVELLLEEGKVDAVIENGTDFQTDCTAPTEGANTVETSSVEAGGCNNTASADDDHSKLGVLNKDGVLAADLACDEKDPSCNNAREEPIMDSRASIENNVDLNNASLDDGENPAFQEVDLQNATITSFDQSVAEDRAEFEDITAGHDTEFLNVNDDEVDDDYDDDGMEADDDTRLLENSGWSSRTRAVSKYLQTLFDKEAEHGRNVLAMNQLLAGKTRKEASRMFFESLVLKTKDYIHVEQEQPFDNIKIMPRSKLMKSNF